MAIAVAIILTGCAGPRFEGTRPGAGQAEFSNDFLECQALARRLVRPDFLDHYAINRTTFICMQGKGWIMTSPKYD
jgi:hypothetical protein